jgi:hypothetical protein
MDSLLMFPEVILSSETDGVTLARDHWTIKAGIAMEGALMAS